jgi:hypothetical protein
MDGLLYYPTPPLDVSSVAGRITSIVARRRAQAERTGDADTAARFDLGLETIYYASLLLMVVEGTGETRSRDELVALLATAEDVIGELRGWLGGQAIGTSPR